MIDFDNIESFRKEFPQLKEKVYDKNLVYFDNAATSLKPHCVLNKWLNFSSKYNANIHRGIHYFSEYSSSEFEKTRKQVGNFIGATSPEEIIFTSGATAAINLVAQSFGEKFINANDEIIITQLEHHSNIVPWQLLCERKKSKLKVLPIDDEGNLLVEELRSLISEKTKLLALSHVSNVLGQVNPIKEIIEICHSFNVTVLIDGSQAVAHIGLDVKDLDCDFYVFSGHKMYAAQGTGVLYGKKEYLNAMPPYMGGGEMIKTVTFEKSVFADLPFKFEAGTPNICNMLTMYEACELCDRLLLSKLHSALGESFKHLYECLDGHERITLCGKSNDYDKRIPLVSFSVKGIHSEDLTLLLDKMGIAVRSGSMCAQPLLDKMGANNLIRVSLLHYNTIGEVNYFISCLEKAIEILG